MVKVRLDLISNRQVNGESDLGPNERNEKTKKLISKFISLTMAVDGRRRHQTKAAG